MLAGTAGAATIVGTQRADLLRGTARPDRIVAGAGDDRITVTGGGADRVACGPGRDLVAADGADRPGRDCELVVRRISSDPFRGLAQHATQVEPDSFAWGSTVVATFQVGRFNGGGAVTNGFAVSRDAGRSWRSGLLPGLTTASRPAGGHTRASDPVVAYDALHRVWLIASLVVTPSRSGELVVSRSADGLRWSLPVIVTAADGDLPVDKEWIVCDNWTSSPYFGSCYMAYSDLRGVEILTQTSRDGGLTWSAPVGAPDAAGRRGIRGSYAPAPLPAVLPSGHLVMPFFDETQMAAIVSTDGGASFSPTIPIAPASFNPVILRGGPLPSAEVDGGGTLYVVWSDCSFRSGCSANDLVLSRSTDGRTWSQPTAIRPAGASAGDRLVPGLGVDPGARGRLAVVWYALGRDRVNAELATSADGGATWSAARRLNPEPMALGWLPRTTAGRMLGDYLSTSFAAGRVVPVVVLAERPRLRYRQATFAASLSGV